MARFLHVMFLVLAISYFAYAGDDKSIDEDCESEEENKPPPPPTSSLDGFIEMDKHLREIVRNVYDQYEKIPRGSSCKHSLYYEVSRLGQQITLYDAELEAVYRAARAGLYLNGLFPFNEGSDLVKEFEGVLSVMKMCIHNTEKQKDDSKDKKDAQSLSNLLKSPASGQLELALGELQDIAVTLDALKESVRLFDHGMDAFEKNVYEYNGLPISSMGDGEEVHRLGDVASSLLHALTEGYRRSYVVHLLDLSNAIVHFCTRPDYGFFTVIGGMTPKTQKDCGDMLSKKVQVAIRSLQARTRNLYIRGQFALQSVADLYSRVLRHMN